MSVPQSNIYICDVRLMPDYRHTLYFKDEAAQQAYFADRVIKTFSDYTFIRKTTSVKVRATLEQARPWSYLYTRNTENGLWNYYFITNAE